MRSPLDGPLQRLPRLRMLDWGQAVVVPEATHERLIGTEAARLLASDRVADASREHPEGIRAGGDDSGDEVVLHGKNVFGAEGTVVRLRPQMSAGARVNELDRDP